MNSGNDTFQMNINGFAGILVPGPVTVYIGGATDFRDGLSTMTGLAAGSNIRVVGLLVKDPLSGNPVLLARHVDQLN